MPVVIGTVAWVRVENGRILCAWPRGKDVFFLDLADQAYDRIVVTVGNPDDVVGRLT